MFKNRKYILLRIYIHNTMQKDAGLIAERNQNEYEKNKARARKANIQFPTPIPTGFSTLINISDPNRFSLQFSQMDQSNLLHLQCEVSGALLHVLPPAGEELLCRDQGFILLLTFSFSFSIYTPRRTNCCAGIKVSSKCIFFLSHDESLILFLFYF